MILIFLDYLLFIFIYFFILQGSELQETPHDLRWVLVVTLLTPLKQLKASLHDEFVIDLDSRFHMFFTFNCLLIFVTFVTTTYMVRQIFLIGFYCLGRRCCYQKQSFGDVM